jgi:hypothetical protein
LLFVVLLQGAPSLHDTMEHHDNESYFTDDDLGDFEVDSVRDAKKEDEQKKDEVRQIHQLALSETIRMRFWRFVVLILLVITGIVVSSVTYLLLLREEDNSFLTEVSSVAI